jgi:hypothetical protein
LGSIGKGYQGMILLIIGVTTVFSIEGMTEAASGNSPRGPNLRPPQTSNLKP